MDAKADNRSRPTAWRVEALLREHRDSLSRYAYVLTGNVFDAEDILQDVVLRLIDRDVSDVANIAAFATRSITNEFLSRRRSAQRLQILANGLHDTSSAVTSDLTNEVAERDLLKRALDALSARQRAALCLKYLRDLDDVDIADLLGCTPSTVRSLIHRGKLIMRARLVDWEEV